MKRDREKIVIVARLSSASSSMARALAAKAKCPGSIPGGATFFAAPKLFELVSKVYGQ